MNFNIRCKDCGKWAVHRGSEKYDGAFATHYCDVTKRTWMIGIAELVDKPPDDGHEMP